MNETDKKPPSARLAWLRRIATLAATVGLLVYIFRSVPLDATWQAVREAGPLLPVVAFAYFLYCFAADSIATWATFRWFCAPLALADVFAIRGATYLLAIVNYNLGQGGMVYVVGRKPGVGYARATGTVLLTMGVMVVALLMLAAFGSAFGPEDEPRLRLMGLVSAVGLGGLVLYLGLVALRPARLARIRVFQPLFDAGILGHAKAWLVRFPHVGGHIVFQWLLLRLFRVEVPFTTAACLLPVVLVIGWLPITIQGLGTQQLAVMELFAPYAAAPSLEAQNAQVLAYSLSLTGLFVLYSAVTGLLCLRRAGRASRRPAAASSDPPA
ncbi:MAG: flippase-like domain-containing protein [Polyangiaceae bacterium]|nr:flippase-like domain-containing protein [Polyangiaceae bacterium]